MPLSPRSPIFKFHRPTGNTTASGVYVSPYLSCKDCNALNFINATPIGMGFDLVAKGKPPVASGKYILDIRQRLASLRREVLPVCVGCGRTIHLAVGVRDFTPQLAEEAAAFQRSGDTRYHAAVQLQCAGRRWLARSEAHRRRVEKAKRDAVERRAAVTVQRRMRGVISRQTTRIQSGICIIQWAHPMMKSIVLDESKWDSSRPPLFWFEGDDLTLICTDYRNYLDRCGPLMTLRRFESNVVQFVHRINEMERKMATRIQAQWRGLKARREVATLKSAMAVLEEVRFKAAVLIQRTVRRYAGGKHTRRHSFQRRQEKIRQRAKLDNLKRRRANGLRRDVDQVNAMYQTYRRNADRVAAWVVPSNAACNPIDAQRKTQAFAAFASAYGSSASRATLRHRTKHKEALRQIHAFVSKSCIGLS
ncbi:hypothetical protein, variant 2 [Aphanomyces invadans]|uniref:Uncharacterized protein n=1 Tax=Aphanomyces invadans TaxID=157072 RepID=A0A024U4U1_9STRA|nr:hypothetical protein, variant 2 [Aphanomyces invadans]ETW01265.1 hypothetical protein, variant 2 [Aphanomyces invadans]|eukprot:XP_008870263.1 hypothetical protein, variant 2 [Aphanomyces invadans]